MARTIRSSDPFKDKLYKLIPSEIVVAWMALKGLFDTNTEAWIIFGLVLFLTPIYWLKFHKVTDIPQLIGLTLSFVVWAISIGGLPLDGMGLFETLPHLPSVILILWTLLIPVLITMPTQKKKPAKSKV